MGWTVAIGVDTHKRTHTAVALDRVGVQLGSCEIEATSSGYARLLAWAQQPGEPAFALEGAGSYGAGLARLLVTAGVAVYEVERPRRQERRRGKNDLLDAARAAGRLLNGDGLSELRGGGQAREDLRLLLLERRSAIGAHTAALNQLHALLLTAPAELRQRLDGLRGEKLAGRCSRLRPRDNSELVLVSVLRRLAAAHACSRASWQSWSRSSSGSSPLSSPNCSTSAALDRFAPPNSSSPAAIPNGCAAKPLSPRSPAPARSKPPAAPTAATDSTAAATANSTAPCTRSPAPASAATPKPAPTTIACSPAARPNEKRSAASNAHSADASTNN